MSQDDLSPDDWAQAALIAWGEGGFSAVAVEPLARRLGVTKGSFYWHFKSRAALIEAALMLWEKMGTDAVIRRLRGLGDPRERLRALFEEAWDRVEYLKAEAAIGAAALSGEPLVVGVYRRVQKRRLNYLTHLYEELGFPRGAARRRAVALYSSFLGSAQIIIIGEVSIGTDAQLKRQAQLFVDLHVPK